MDAVVDERRQSVLVDGVPQAQLGGDAILEPAEQRQSVAAFGRRGKPQELAGSHMVEQSSIGRSRGVVELVDDHDIEVTRIEICEPGGIQALDRCEDVLEASWALPADPELTEGVVAQAVAKRRQALLEDLLAMGNEQEPRTRQLVAQPRVVDGRHDGLACARRRRRGDSGGGPCSRTARSARAAAPERARDEARSD